MVPPQSQDRGEGKEDEPVMGRMRESWFDGVKDSTYWSFAFFPSARRTGSQIALLAIETPGATRGHRGKWIMS